MAGTARAQFGVYATITGENFNGITCADPQNECAANNGTAKPYGSSFGAQYDWRKYGPALVGFDVRGEALNSNKSAANDSGGTDLVRHYAALGGARASFSTPFKVVRPYVEVAAGLGRTNAASAPSNAYQNFTQVQGFAGIDLALFSVLDIRVIELGAGELFGPSSHSIQSIGLGVVFHLPR